MSIYDKLNEPQREAVYHTDGPLLILAGAGSGKTRVLTHRIAYLIEERNVNPWNILAITFTNKAAGEMRERVDSLVGFGSESIWVSTFHSMCVRILRRFIDRLGYDNRFTIYDTDDQKTLMKEVCKKVAIDTKVFKERSLMSAISSAKNELILPDEFELNAGGDFAKLKIAKVYREYEAQLKANNALDFDDLLVKTVQLLQTQPDVLENYQERFRYIMVDEYQDTNTVQFQLVRLLAGKYRNLCVVGDDDQSIYSWRGADIRNILEFERDWPEAKTVKLEENYRSTATILECANAVIAHNQSRKSKELFTRGERGEKVAVFLAADERDEGRWIAATADDLHARGSSYNDIAVFYRTNAQSRILEDMFLRAGVPYRIVGGTRFFDRAEIRDVTAYLNVILNPADDVSCMRIINTPRRGIGKTTIERISLTAMQRDIPFLEATRSEALDPACRAATRRSLEQFIATRPARTGATCMPWWT